MLELAEITILGSAVYQNLRREVSVEMNSRVVAPNLNYPREYYEIVMMPGDPSNLSSDPRYHPSQFMETIAGEVTTGFRKFAKQTIAQEAEVNWRNQPGWANKWGVIEVTVPVDAFEAYVTRISQSRPPLAA